jgi:DNA-binding response OmpR family regulator
VDDEVLVRASLKTVFEEDGWIVVALPDGESAMAAVTREQFDLLLLDKNLPGMLSGLDVARKVREGRNTVPIILMTAYPTVESAMRAMPYRIDAYVLKPFEDVYEVAYRARHIVERWERDEEQRRIRVAQWQRRESEDADTPVDPALGAGSGTGAAPGTAPRFVVASASPTEAAWIARQLEGPARRIAVARTLDELRLLLAGDPADVVLLDLSLEDAVLPALNALRAMPRAPTVLVTGDRPSLGMLPNLIGAGAVGFLERPYGSGSTFRQRVAHLLRPLEPHGTL